MSVCFHSICVLCIAFTQHIYHIIVNENKICILNIETSNKFLNQLFSNPSLSSTLLMCILQFETFGHVSHHTAYIFSMFGYMYDVCNPKLYNKRTIQICWYVSTYTHTICKYIFIHFILVRRTYTDSVLCTMYNLITFENHRLKPFQFVYFVSTQTNAVSIQKICTQCTSKNFDVSNYVNKYCWN